jgi:hypothetical protein
VSIRSAVVVSREGLRVRDISDEDGNRLLRIVRLASGSVATWPRAQRVLLSVQAVDVGGITKVTSTSANRARDVANNFNDVPLRLFVPEVRGRSAAHLHVAAAMATTPKRPSCSARFG